MLRFLVVRSLQGIIALFIFVSFVFALIRTSGSPVDLLVPPEGGRELREMVTKMWGLDKPIYVQYAIYLKQVFRGDLGKSVVNNQPVLTLIKHRLPISGRLALYGLGFALLVGIPLGIWAAVKRGSPLDGFVRGIAVLGQAMPSFWLGLMLMNILAVRLKLLPTSGMGDWRHYIMPGFVLGWFIVAGIMRLLRSSMLEVLDSEYVKMARIKGVSENSVIWKHTLRNALIPVVTYTGLYLALLITASIIVESVFAYPGYGQLVYTAILFRDFPVIQGAVLTAAALVIAVNLVVDVAYTYIDPRVKIAGRK